MQVELADYDRLAVPSVSRERSTGRLLVMEEIQGVQMAKAPDGPERVDAARQLLESFYNQIIVEGCFTPILPPAISCGGRTVSPSWISAWPGRWTPRCVRTSWCC